MSSSSKWTQSWVGFAHNVVILAHGKYNHVLRRDVPGTSESYISRRRGKSKTSVGASIEGSKIGVFGHIKLRDEEIYFSGEV